MTCLPADGMMCFAKVTCVCKKGFWWRAAPYLLSRALKLINIFCDREKVLCCVCVCWGPQKEWFCFWPFKDCVHSFNFLTLTTVFIRRHFHNWKLVFSLIFGFNQLLKMSSLSNMKPKISLIFWIFRMHFFNRDYHFVFTMWCFPKMCLCMLQKNIKKHWMLLISRFHFICCHSLSCFLLWFGWMFAVLNISNVLPRSNDFCILSWPPCSVWMPTGTVSLWVITLI